MPSRARLSLCAVSLLVTLAGCAATPLKTTAPPGLQLSGNWALDPAASEDVGRAVTTLRAQIDKALHLRRHAQPAAGFGGPMRRRASPGDSDERSGERGGGTPASGQAAGAARPSSALVQELLAYVPGGYLTISTAPDSFSIGSANASEQYSPGIQTAVELGSSNAEQSCGWQGRRFVIETRPEWGPAMTQSYGLAPDGKLVATVRLHGEGIDTTVTLRYQRTKEAPAALLPTTD